MHAMNFRTSFQHIPSGINNRPNRISQGVFMTEEPKAVLTAIPTHYANICKVARTITGDPEVAKKPWPINVLGKKHPLSVMVEIDFDKVYVAHSVITPFDIAVCDAVFTLVENGIQTFTLEMLCRALAGNEAKKVTDKLRNAVADSMDKMRHTDIRIDCTEEFLKRKLIRNSDLDWRPEHRYILTSYMMPVEIMEYIRTGNNKHVKRGYRLLKIPALYEYAKEIEQIAGIPAEMFDACRPLSDTVDTILLKRYLFKRIEGMKNPRNHLVSNAIRYEWYDIKERRPKGLYQDLCIQSDSCPYWRKKKSDIHQTVCAILDCLVKAGCIKSYRVDEAANRRILGVTIDCG